MIIYKFYYFDFNYKLLWFSFNNNYFYTFCIIENFINVLNVFKHKSLYAEQSLNFFIISFQFFYFNIIKKLITDVENELFKHMIHDFNKLYYWICHFLWKSCSLKQINQNHNHHYITIFFNKRNLIIFKEHINQWDYMHVCKFFKKFIN